MLETVRKLFNSSVIEDQMLGIELAKELNINDLISLFPEEGSHGSRLISSINSSNM